MSSGVEFDVDKAEFETRGPSHPMGSGGYSGMQMGGGGNQPKMVRWLLKHGVVKTPGAANAVLVALVLINILITYIVIAYFL